MARFSTDSSARVAIARAADTLNREGVEAYSQTDEMKLASIMLTSFVQDQFYRGASDTTKELKALIQKVDPEFAAKAAIYARTEFGMRSITHITAAEVAQRVKGEKWTKRFIDKVIYRPDDATEILAYQLANYGKPVPNSLKKGLARGISKFDAYQLAKYRGDKHAVSLVDVVNLVHIKPNVKNRDALEQLVEGTLRSADTWETKVSAAGKSEDKQGAKAQAWSDLVRERKIGYFALLRNLRNIEEQAPEVLDEALAMLVDEKLIRKSLVLPFRYMTALEQVQKTKTVQALNRALDISVSNVPKLDGKTLIAVDHSGSMGSGLNSPKGKGDLFAAVLFKANDADVMVFGTTAGYVSKLNPDDSTLSIASQIEKVNHGWGTNFSEVYKHARDKYTRIVTLSDMQSWMGYGTPVSAANAYEKNYRVKPHFYNFDLAGYGTTMFPTERVYELVGFSEKVFDIMKLLETDKRALINRINQVEL